MVVRLLPDVEALVVTYLKADAAIIGLVGPRVSTEIPPNPTWPLLTLTLVAGVEKFRTHLDEQIIQVDAWGGDKASANLLARTARAVLLEAPSSTHTRGVVTCVRTTRLPQWRPDTEVAPPRPRYSADYAFTLHPNPL